MDNHDVTRVASILSNKEHLPLIYAMLFGMPGIPCVYYGSEWGAEARKEEGDPALRACFEAPEWNDLTEYISVLTKVKKASAPLNYGSFVSSLLTNKQCVFERNLDGKRVYVAINADSCEFTAHFNAGASKCKDLLTDTEISMDNGLVMPAYSAFYLEPVE